MPLPVPATLSGSPSGSRVGEISAEIVSKLVVLFAKLTPSLLQDGVQSCDLQGRWLAAEVGAHDSPRASLQLQRGLKKLVRCHPKPILPMQLFCAAFPFARYEGPE